MFDLLLRGGEVIDGTGGPRRTADIAIRDGHVVELGRITESSKQVMDVDGLVVTPGFIDIHTHYDAQVFWDPCLTPSSLYGVTTALAGNCGFSVAPLGPDSADYVKRMLARVEGMPIDALNAGVSWNWSSTSDYFQKLHGKIGINIGFLVGHSAVRRLVMGEDALARHATEDELTTMGGLVRAGLEAGALGFSSSRGLAHVDWEGTPVPSRHANVDEFVNLAGICQEFVGTSLELIPDDVVSLTDEQLRLMADMSAAAKRPLNWNLLRITAATEADVMKDLRGNSIAREVGGKVVALTMPIPSRARFSFETGFVLDAIPGWASTLHLPMRERQEALSDPTVRAKLLASSVHAASGHQALVDWGSKVISEGFSASARAYEGRHVRDIAKEEGKADFDTLLDIVCNDNLRTTFSYGSPPLSFEDWQANLRVWRSGDAVIGGSDAGAHLDFTANHDYPAFIIEQAVRQHAVLSLEEAVHYLTDVPARLYGMRGRGVIEQGSHADFAVFEEASFGSGKLETRFDLPAGAGRLFSAPCGMHKVIVGGQLIVDDGEVTEARAGLVLRAGRDTATPSLS